MTDKDLEKANSLKKEIKEIEDFLFYAERTVLGGKIVKTVEHYIFKSNGDRGVFESELNLNNEMKEKMLEIVRDYLANLKKQLEDI